MNNGTVAGTRGSFMTQNLPYGPTIGMDEKGEDFTHTRWVTNFGHDPFRTVAIPRRK